MIAEGLPMTSWLGIPTTLLRPLARLVDDDRPPKSVRKAERIFTLKRARRALHSSIPNGTQLARPAPHLHTLPISPLSSTSSSLHWPQVSSHPPVIVVRTPTGGVGVNAPDSDLSRWRVRHFIERWSSTRGFPRYYHSPMVVRLQPTTMGPG